MDNSLRMGVGNAPRQLLDQPGRPIRLPGRPVELSIQTAPRQIFQLDVRQAVHIADRVNLHDMGMMKPGDRLCFGEEPCRGLGRGVDAGEDHLERTGAVQLHLPGLVDHPHAATAQLVDDLVPGNGDHGEGRRCWPGLGESGRRVRRASAGIAYNGRARLDSPESGWPAIATRAPRDEVGGHRRGVGGGSIDGLARAGDGINRRGSPAAVCDRRLRTMGRRRPLGLGLGKTRRRRVIPDRGTVLVGNGRPSIVGARFVITGSRLVLQLTLTLTGGATRPVWESLILPCPPCPLTPLPMKPHHDEQQCFSPNPRNRDRGGLANGPSYDYCKR